MESTGRAFRIHLSASTYTKLKTNGLYIMQYRGEIVLKGKGKQSTYWLTGKVGFDKELPEPAEDEYVLIASNLRTSHLFALLHPFSLVARPQQRRQPRPGGGCRLQHD